MQDEDAEDDLEDAQDDGFLIKREDFEARRTEIGQACDTAERLVGRLGEDVPGEWRQALKHGIRVERYVALSTADKMEAIFLRRQAGVGRGEAPGLAEVKARMEARQREWRAWDSESYESMDGEEMFEAFKR